MLLVVVFLASAVLSFALSIAVAGLLGPGAFGRYAIGLSLGLLVNTALFEWLRLSTIRFYPGAGTPGHSGIRRRLDRAYAASAAVLCAATAAWLAIEPDLGPSKPLAVAIAACGLALGLFEFAVARARARFDDRRFAALILARGAGGLVLASAAAWLTGEPAAVLGGWALAGFAAIAATSGRSRDPAVTMGADTAPSLAALARYAAPIVIAGGLYQAVPLLNLTLLAGRSGFEPAGYLSLAGEIGMRLFQNIGAALDITLFQLAVRADAVHGREAADAQIGRNIAAAAAVVFPVAAGLWVVWPSFEAVFVPTTYRGTLEPAMTWLIPALACFTLAHYAVGAAFGLRGRTSPLVAAALVAAALDAAIVLAWPGLDSPADFAAAQAVGSAVGLAVLTGWAFSAGARLPWRDLAKAALAASVMTALLVPGRQATPGLATLILHTLAGMIVYVGLAVVFDLAGARAIARQGWRRLART